MTYGMMPHPLLRRPHRISSAKTYPGPQENARTKKNRKTTERDDQSLLSFILIESGPRSTQSFGVILSFTSSENRRLFSSEKAQWVGSGGDVEVIACSSASIREKHVG